MGVNVDLYGIGKTLSRSLTKTNGELKRFIEFQKASGIGDKRLSKQLYAGQELLKLLGKPFANATREDVERVLIALKDKGQSAETERHKRIIFKQLIRFAKGVKDGDREPDCIAGIKGGKKGVIHAPRKQILEPEDVHKLVSSCMDLEFRLFTNLLFWTGGRVSEVRNIRLKDCDVKDGRLMVTLFSEKTDGEARIIPVAESQSVLIFEEYFKLHPKRFNPDALLFPTQMSHTALAKRMNRLAKNSGIIKPINFHWFRHSYFTWAAERGFSESAIRYMGGWRSGEMAARYISSSKKLVMEKFSEIYGKGEDETDRLLDSRGKELLDKLLSKPERARKIVKWIIEDDVLPEWQSIKEKAQSVGKIKNEAPLFLRKRASPRRESNSRPPVFSLLLFWSSFS